MLKIVDYVVETTNKYIEQMPKELRKKNGQFFTSKETAIFMASLFDFSLLKKEVTILDPGAGSGILTAALVQQIIDTKLCNKITITCYETNSNILELLKNNLHWLKNNSSINIEYQIITDNYITQQKLAYNNLLENNVTSPKYDFVIGNPPYMKISKQAKEALAMPDICYGAPNLYFLFMQMGCFNLKKNAELVFIVPRSWTSGMYFKKFREKFLNEVAINHIHLFTSRNKVFDKENILQETIIIKVKKTNINPKTITITTTNSNCDFAEKTLFLAPYNLIFSKKNKYVFLVTDIKEAKIIEKINSLQETLISIDCKMKTGLTVDFRYPNCLRNKAEEKTVPLFYPQHIKDGKVIFPIAKSNEYITTEQKGLLQKNTNYLFVKRFTSKEEKRRLQCGVYLASSNPHYQQISTQNKINFITGLQELSDYLLYGLYVIMNSTIYDNYYRILNGSTQVNATEINSMPIPQLSCIENMGKELLKSSDMSEETCDDILERVVHV